MIQALLISGGAAMVVAVAVSLLVSRRMALPIQNLLRASQRIAAGRYHERVAPTGSDELAVLAQQFNVMAEALEHAERRRAALIGDIAHELRTPLATIEGYAEGALDGVVAADSATWALILDEVGRLRRLVADLQELSCAEAKQLPLHLTPILPAALVERATARLQPQFDDKRRHPRLHRFHESATGAGGRRSGDPDFDQSARQCAPAHPGRRTRRCNSLDGIREYLVSGT